MKNKEYGSDFHYLSDHFFRDLNFSNNFDKSVDELYFSGRVALYDILIFGIQNKGWKKIYIPSYYCHEVYQFIQSLNITLEFYSYNPVDNIVDFEIDDKKENVVLRVNYFGIINPIIRHLKNVTIIDDVTHDLNLIKSSDADYIFGSLRKVLPVPVGGFLKSKVENNKNLNISHFAEFLAMKKISGMFLKAKYLNGEFDSKDTFRQLLSESEYDFENLETLSKIPTQALEYLKNLNINEIIFKKQKNILSFKRFLLPNDFFELFTSDSNTDFALILKFKDVKHRNAMKSHLIKHSIYPMVLWPNQVNEIDKKIENSLLFIHADFRYSTNDIEFISKVINDYLND